MSGLTAGEIARALGGRNVGSGWICRCVAHDDRNPSLSISQGEGGCMLVHCFAGCDPTDIIAELRRRGLWPQRPERGRNVIVQHRATRKVDEAKANPKAGRVWQETVDPRGTWVERYLASRGLRLPADPEVLLRTLRFHPHCAFPDRTAAPALLCAFTPISIPDFDDPFLEPSPVAVHRIRGRGHDNKAMLGPVRGCAVMISPWWQVGETLNVCEGVETALALYNEGALDPAACYRPIWALGSAWAIRTFPVISGVKKLRIFADNDTNAVGLHAAKEAATRWQQAGKEVAVRHPREEGADYAD